MEDTLRTFLLFLLIKWLPGATIGNQEQLWNFKLLRLSSTLDE